jgi:membrane protein implicated in regulation of membrane protease activity
MQLKQTQAVIAAAWLIIICLVALVAGVSSWTTGALLTAIAILPLLAMRRWWKDPEQTLSESIRESR